MSKDTSLFTGADTDAGTGTGISFDSSSIVRSRRILYTPSAFARASLFYLQEAGSLKAVKPHTNARKGLDSFLFFIVTAGRGSLRFDGKQYGLKAGDCVFIDCQKPYSHSTGIPLQEASGSCAPDISGSHPSVFSLDTQSRDVQSRDAQSGDFRSRDVQSRDAQSGDIRSNDIQSCDALAGFLPQPLQPGLWTLKWAHFCGAEMGAVYEKYKARGGQPVFRPAETDGYAAVLDQLYQVAVSDSYVRDMEIHAVLSQLLVLLMKDAWPERDGDKDGKQRAGRGRQPGGRGAAAFDIQAVKQYLDGHYTERISLDGLASRFFINKFYLLKRFKVRYGTTINDYLIHKRVTRAKQLLRFGSDKDGNPLTIEEISLECGFSNGAYMSRVFKRAEGMSPGEYRKIW